LAGISTHVLDTAKGLPVAGMAARLDRQDGAIWTEAGSGATDSNGRIAVLGTVAHPGVYRLTFATGPYFQGQDSFYPEVSVVFEIRDASRHHHIPLLLSPYGYTTYRGS